MYVNLYACFFLKKRLTLCIKQNINLGVILNSSMTTSSDLRQTRKFYAQANMLMLNFRYCTIDVKCMLFKSFCANMYCCVLFNFASSSIEQLKTRYSSALRNLLLTKKPYSAITILVTHDRTRVYRFADCVNKNSNSITMTWYFLNYDCNFQHFAVTFRIMTVKC